MLRRASIAFTIAAASLATARAGAADPWSQRVIDRAEYADHLRGMWLGACIANWTGRTTEGHWTTPPFLTDADWGATIDGRTIDFVLDQDPWLADDDTDIEYVYESLIEEHHSPLLTPEQIREGWIDHINRYIWVSNATARALMDRGARPPATGIGIANANWAMIDAQIECEVFGALAPGLPARALEIAEWPIRAVSGGHATHAAQFFTTLYALAPLVDRTRPPRDQAVWLVTEARHWIPDGSKASDVVDFVLADYLDNADKDHWEQTRDRIYDRYDLNAAANGFVYRAWYESSVNLACGVMALLYGEMDLPRTIQIGTLAGWDSDCPTATMGGLLGLVKGHDAVAASFPGHAFSDRYCIVRTRDNMEDHLPDDTEAEDTFAGLADRMMSTVADVLDAEGARFDPLSERWLLPPERPVASRVDANPVWRLYRRSANNMVRLGGGSVTATSSVVSDPPAGLGRKYPRFFANGFALDFSGAERPNADAGFYSTLGAPNAQPGDVHTLTTDYHEPIEVFAVCLVEGDHYPRPGQPGDPEGGWFDAVQIELLVDGVWQPADATLSEPLDAEVPFQIIEFTLPEPVIASAVRISGPVGGADAFVTCGELDALLAPPPQSPTPSLDADGNGRVDIEDLYAWHADPGDLDNDGDADQDDASYLEMWLRWTELVELRSGRR